MHWIHLSLISAFLLGIYDLFKKHAVTGNAVMPVLFLTNLTAALIWVIPILLSAFGGWDSEAYFYVGELSASEHLKVFIKAVIVGTSWMCSYFALKRLPVSIAVPIRATGPFWTLLGAFLILGERPDGFQFGCIVWILLFFWLFSMAGKNEGIVFHRSKAVGFMVLATLFAAISGLYDKYLLRNCAIEVNALQAWFSVYLAVYAFPFAWGWYRRWWPSNAFYWRGSIPLIAVSLLLADFVYFHAMQQPDALVMLISPLRRSSVLVSFTIGYWWFGERNYRRKLIPVLGILAGVIALALHR
jgi:drug/metabolite transporter (DMT)-like permease